ncbi:hypothetical protein A9995_11140 [Erythrobacter sp. QSSC1-22B]|uniref:hypothetical protein n=1 Tax=Erythrobacter sp. QSSC1-22B TaxID=1860125 RepID=UPI000805C091|nr:hypothetical protein [Erythrobacter sp. QSSC1-22B]OBX18518.1 hypothetical protein A9995_11140 [Erythrobacter sp. QSSC1-22B]
MSCPARLALPAFCALALSACAGTGEDYPSLAIRDVERAKGQFEPIPVAPIDVPEIPVNYEGSLEGRLATLVESARAAHARFTRSEGSARRTVAGTGRAAVGSDNWGAAQVALSDLESIRSDTAIALADLDILHIAASIAAEDRVQIDAARETVIALVQQEDAALAELRARVTP